jgi:cytochrome c oxidase subunit 4
MTPAHGDHVVPVKTYLTVFAVLIVLTITTAMVAFVDLGVFNVYVALTIAVVKALLVILYFMHVKYSPSITKVYVAAGFFWLLILLSLILTDYFTRNWLPIDRAW